MPLPLLSALAKNGASALHKVSAQTGNAVAGTRKSIAHGLKDHAGNAVVPTIAIPVLSAPDADGALAAADVRIVSMDATNVVVRCSVANQPFDLYVG
jgi:hypothetical protein